MKGLQINNIFLSRITGLSNTIFSAAIAILSVPFIISKIDLLGYGQWSVIWIFIGIAAFLDLGVSKQLVQNIAYEKNDDEKIKNIVGAKKIITFIQSIIFLLHLLSFLIVVLILKDNSYNAYFLISLVTLFGTIQFNLYKSLFEGFQKVYISNIYSLLQTIIFYALSFFALSLNLEVQTMTIISSLAFIITPSIMFLHLRIKLNVKNKINIQYKAIKEMYLNSIYFFNFNLIASIPIPLARVILVSTNPSLHGAFDIGLKIAMSAQALLSSLTLHLHAQLRLLSQNKKLLRSAAEKNSLICLLFFLVGNFLFFFIGDIILDYLFNNQNSYFLITFLLLISLTSTSIFEPFLRSLWATEKIGITVKSRIFVIIGIIFSPLIQYGTILDQVIIGYALGLAVSNIYIFYYFKTIR